MNSTQARRNILGPDFEQPAPGLDAGLASGNTGRAQEDAPGFNRVAEGRNGWRITARTEDYYALKASSLWRAAALRKASRLGDTEAPALVSPLEVVKYLEERGRPQDDLQVQPLERRLSKNTWQSYRSALLWDLARAQGKAFEEAVLALEAMQYPQAPPKVGRPTKAQEQEKTSRGIPKADLVRLIDQLGSMNRHMKWGARVQYWLQAGIATGLRPGEWQFAQWADEAQDLLLAPTMKDKADTPAAQRHRIAAADATPDEGAALKRKTPIHHLRMRAIPVDPSDRIFVAQHLSSIQQAAELGFSFEAYQNYCRQTLWRACRRLWDGAKTYHLYQCRHQFSANARGKMGRDELAAVMGHNRKDTSAKYANSRHAYRKSPITDRAPQEGDRQAEATQPPADGPAPQAGQPA